MVLQILEKKHCDLVKLRIRRIKKLVKLWICKLVLAKVSDFKKIYLTYIFEAVLCGNIKCQIHFQSKQKVKSFAIKRKSFLSGSS